MEMLVSPYLTNFLLIGAKAKRVPTKRVKRRDIKGELGLDIRPSIPKITKSDLIASANCTPNHPHPININGTDTTIFERKEPKQPWARIEAGSPVSAPRAELAKSKVSTTKAETKIIKAIPINEKLAASQSPVSNIGIEAMQLAYN